MILFAGTRGHLDTVPVTEVRRYETELLDFVRSRHGGLLNEIVSTKVIDEGALERVIADFAETFEVDGAPAAAPGIEGQADAATMVVDSAHHLPEEDVSRPETQTSGR